MFSLRNFRPTWILYYFLDTEKHLKTCRFVRFFRRLELFVTRYSLPE